MELFTRKLREPCCIFANMAASTHKNLLYIFVLILSSNRYFAHSKKDSFYSYSVLDSEQNSFSLKNYNGKVSITLLVLGGFVPL